MKPDTSGYNWPRNPNRIRNESAARRNFRIRFARMVLAVGWFLASAALGVATVRYVDVNSASPTPPYTSWQTAAATIQDAVDASVTNDEIIVTNGVYSTGGRAVFGAMTNRVAITNALTVRSVNGPLWTRIQGFPGQDPWFRQGAVRCVYLTSAASLSGFTLTNGASLTEGDLLEEQSGGGLFCTDFRPPYSIASSPGIRRSGWVAARLAAR